VKPDVGKARDKQRLADKKSAKAAAKAARKAAAADPVPHDARAELEAHIKGRRGQNRKAAFARYAALDVDGALSFVRGLAREADGKNLAELGALLLGVREGASDPRIVDDAARGRYGDVAVWEHAPSAVAAALERLRHVLAAIAPDDVPRRARALGAVPLQLPARHASETAALLVAVLEDTRFVAVAADAAPGARAARAAFVRAVCDALVEVAPAALWVRREHATPEQAALAAVAAETVAPDEIDVERLAAWLERLPAADRSARLRAARLPDAAARLPLRQRVLLLRLLLADAGAPALHRERAALALAEAGTDEAIGAVLAAPEASTAATVRACARLDFDEAWSVLGPLFFARVEVRDALLATAHAREPRMLDVALRLLVGDPVCAAAYLGRSEHPRALVEIERAFDVCEPADAPALLFGLVVDVLSPRTRAWAATASVGDVVARVPEPERRAGWRLALQALQPRAGASAAAIARALERLDEIER
jgi:hypothetical protein